uniref:Protein kinase domain-containing protein n=1 Tax=Phlebotomus papatasi TaxID=29031 RepID=A0A1B0DMC7_PHLPP
MPLVSLYSFSIQNSDPTVCRLSMPYVVPREMAVTDPRDGRRVALKKLPNVFQSLVSSKRVFRELKMLCFFKHENMFVGHLNR